MLIHQIFTCLKFFLFTVILCMYIVHVSPSLFNKCPSNLEARAGKGQHKSHVPLNLLYFLTLHTSINIMITTNCSNYDNKVNVQCHTLIM